MGMNEGVQRFWHKIGRLLLAVLVIAGSLLLFAGALRHRPSGPGVPFHDWYGNWGMVALASGVFLLFLLGFARPRRPGEWRGAGLYSAFLISLFTEMFGVPLTIYLISPLLGVSPWTFGVNESHLWAYLLSRLGLATVEQGVYAVMVLSVGLIALGASLVALGWQRVYSRGGELVTDGIYRVMRHPQYLGLILIVLAFNIQWPTLPTLLMAPILIVMYVWLALREDRELESAFGAPFADYRERVPAFLPWPRPARRLGTGVRGLRGTGDTPRVRSTPE